MVGLDSLEGTRWVLSLSRGMIGLALLVISFTIPPEKIIGIWILELFVVPGGLYLEAMLSSQYPTTTALLPGVLLSTECLGCL